MIEMFIKVPFKSLSLIIALYLFWMLYGCTDNNHKPNVLFIAVDDLRPELGCYGKDYIKSPNIDKLAEEGIVFANHYANVPTCGASRYTLLTGMLPRNPVQVGNGAIEHTLSGKQETDTPETFIHHLKRNGYYTIGIGKISHSADGLLYGYNDPVGTERELPFSWDELVFDAGKWETGWNAFFGYADGSNRQSRNRQVKPYEKADVADEGYPDGLTANLALKKLRERADALKDDPDTPFFLGVGFFKPHLPFNSPSGYWDQYETDLIPLSESPGIPENVSPASLHQSGEFNQYALGEEKASLDRSMSDNYSRLIRNAYFAAISYVDAQIGKLTSELKELNLDKNTAVVIWGDHGWHLGDHRVWGKHTLFEYALKSTLIMKVPDQFSIKNKIVETTVSTIDIYPTLMEICGVGMPFETDGRSLVPLINGNDPDYSGEAFGYWQKGISVRTDRYRLTRYFREQDPVIELFDYQIDPFETRNIAGERPELADSLLVIWRKGNTGIYDQLP
jgi:arylsulfatase A-like enzyme